MNNLENIKKIIVKKPLKLDCGKTISDYPIAYETYGKLSEKKDNAILAFPCAIRRSICSWNKSNNKKPGWWSYLVGPSKAIDTNKFFVICANVIGGCMGSYGPSSIDIKTSKKLGTNFPVITINDMVNAQYNLLDYFKIDKLFSVMGGSMGGMQVLQFVANYPNKTKTAVPIACTASHSAQNIALNELGRQAIMADSNWQKGDYLNLKNSPDKGLSVARMAAHITYLSKRFTRKIWKKTTRKR